MLKKTVKYTDFDGVEKEKDLYFHLTKAELVELEAEVPGGLSSMIENIAKTNDAHSIITMFKKIVLKAYGERTSTGDFVKVNDSGIPLYIRFSSSEAYSQLFMELCSDSDKASDFFNGIVPKDV